MWLFQCVWVKWCVLINMFDIDLMTLQLGCCCLHARPVHVDNFKEVHRRLILDAWIPA